MSNIINYPAKLSQLDAGKILAYRLRNGNYTYYRVPDFLIIGAQKCGTREITNWLSEHPKLVGYGGEQHFFDEVAELEAEWPRYVMQPIFRVSRDMRPIRDVLCFEKTPAYLDMNNGEQPVAALVQQLMPSGKLIALLRNPTARAYSCHHHRRKGRNFHGVFKEHNTEDFTTLVEKHIAGKGEDKRMLAIGHYAEHLSRWLSFFKREQLHIVLYEDFVKASLKTMADLLDFLQVEPFDYQPLIKKNSRGFTVLKNTPSKADRAPYPPIPGTSCRSFSGSRNRCQRRSQKLRQGSSHSGSGPPRSTYRGNSGPRRLATVRCLSPHRL